MAADRLLEQHRKAVVQTDRVKPTFLLWGFILLCAGGSAWLKTGLLEKPAQVVGKLGIGDVPPELELFDLSGRGQSLREIAGHNQLTLVSIWASWCTPCRMEFPALDRLYRKNGSKGLGIVAISVDSERGDAVSFIERRKVRFVVLHDPRGTVKTRWGIDALPTTVLVGRDGRVKATYQGLQPYLEQTIEKQLPKGP